MKKIVFTTRNIVGMVLSGLLGLLGFSACNSQKSASSGGDKSESFDREPRIIAMYGAPQSKFRVIDSVQPENKPIQE